MVAQRPPVSFVFCFAILIVHQAALGFTLEFRTVKVEPPSRIDAIAYLGEGVVIAGSRGTRTSGLTGYVHVSKDYGVTWRTVGNITGADFITCLCSGANGIGYLLTGGDVHVWKTTDYGETWADLGQVSKAANGGHFANAYGMMMTRKGTLLVADADGNGGHIHRSTDQGATWEDMGAISPRPLYRLNKIKDGVIVNGWAGHVYKSTDDGVTWIDMGQVSPAPLYAIENLDDDGTVLIATEDGHVFRSTDNGTTWNDAGKVGDAADDFAWLGGARVLYSTYAGTRSVYLSEDSGVSWKEIAGVPLEPDDWLDHFITVHDRDVRMVVGGTKIGLIVYSRIPTR